jgi:SAM-dependent methyltransferase
MNSNYKDFWEVPNIEEAWMKIILAYKEDPIDTKQTSEIILEGIPRQGIALEVGAGVGRLMSAMSPHFEFVWGVDHSESMVKLSKEHLRDYGNCQIKLGDGFRLPVDSNAFDFVYSYITFQHMADLDCVQKNIKEMYRVLKPGGICRVQTIKGAPYRGEWGEGGMHGCHFEDENDFCKEFLAVGLDATVTVTCYQGIPIVIWVTGTK